MLTLAAFLVAGLALALAAAGRWRGTGRGPATSEAERAYAAKDWEGAARLARERLAGKAGGAGEDPAAVRLLAKASARLGRDEPAVSLFTRLDPATLAAEDFYLLGLSLLRSGRRPEAVATWRRALRVEPDYPEALAALMRLDLAANRQAEAEAAAKALANQPGWEAEAHRVLGQLRSDRNDALGAAEAWAIAVDRAPAEAAGAAPMRALRKDLARAWLRAGRPADALESLRSLAGGPAAGSGAGHPGAGMTADPELSWLFSRAYLQGRDLPAAKAALEAAGPFAEEDPTRIDPSPFVGAAKCAGCHAEIARAQGASRHARTYSPPAALPAEALPPPGFPDPVDASVRHTLRVAGGRLEQETRTAGEVYRAVAQYAFGSGDRGRTFVGRDASGGAFELRLSQYHEGRGREPFWAVTAGQPPHPPVPVGFLGVPETEDQVRRCFDCHVTNPRAVIEAAGPEAADPAIGCEKCHGPGGNHVLAVAAGFRDPAIARPALASGAPVVKICAQCHAPSNKPVDRNDPASVRFQGATLTWSRCYTESGDRLDCVTCHDPHRNAETSPAHYEARCLTCHPGNSGPPPPAKAAPRRRSRRFDLAAAPQAPSCPVNPRSGCIACHMPTVRDAVPHTPFTDHFIRIHPEKAAEASASR
ncbi:Doubled CXXCH motif (Paired_CXXCH_1) [Aquisphaera giovannonii]|uniref:Doubled CXXCH motif (Paired_CXXCH_1) n=1 Tax=Aquisphaera giovannonii TaxID=406548 RepID=A0A5B9W3T9_9BACT|nr:hypothetical protein [Aquisphaera giovannonii]QEH35283.1 Doubled CXXCH motif (Paired_CXXCH_1) [Aquisphaera giovannonii]